MSSTLAHGTLVRRALAVIVDTTILSATATLILGFRLNQRMIDPSSIGLVSSIIFVLAYFVILEWLAGGTLGKLLAGIRVVSTDGTRCSLKAALIRNLLRFVDFLPAFYALGLVFIIRSERKQRLGDLVAGTVIAKHPVPKQPPPPAPFLFH